VWDFKRVIVTVTIPYGTLIYTTWDVARTIIEVIGNVTITSGTLLYSSFYAATGEVIINVTITWYKYQFLRLL
jgi:hypothetical protein